MNRYQKTIKSKNKYREFFRVLNGILQLTPRAIDVAIVLLDLEDNMDAEDLKTKGLIHKVTRKEIMKRVNIKRSNLSQYEHTLKRKSILVVEPNGAIRFNPMFRPNEVDGKVSIEFILNIDN